MKIFTPEEKDRIAKQFTKQMKPDYPDLTVVYIKELIDKFEDKVQVGVEESSIEGENIIEMFLFPELEKLRRHKKYGKY